MLRLFILGVTFLFGAIIGSFLNACIHRMPRGLSLREPKRSFCPACKTMIPWYHNLPILSWLILRGKCASCKARISPRYLIVELLTALLFTGIVYRYGLPVSLPYLLLAAGLIAATFIDVEHFIIPDEITIGGTVAGFLCAVALPEIVGATGHLYGALYSLIGAVVGWGSVRLIVEVGKLAFGKKRVKLDQIEPFNWKRDDDRADVTVGTEVLRWEDLFGRESDLLVVRGKGFAIDGKSVPGNELQFRYDRLLLPEGDRKLDDIDVIKGRVSELVIPREAMGLGDVKLMAAIGAFLGWKAAVFCIAAGSMIGAVFGIAGLLVARDSSGVRLPFGPFLATAAILWLFGGKDLFEWYFSMYR